MDADRVLALLDAAPRQVAELVADVPAAALRRPPATDEWSAIDVLAHLRACADVWGGCIGRLLAEDEPAIRALSPRTYLPRTDYPELEFGPSFEAFVAQREALLRELRALPAVAWSRSASVTGVGRPIRRSVLNYAERLATHERPHVTQIGRAVAAVIG